MSQINALRFLNDQVNNLLVSQMPPAAASAVVAWKDNANVKAFQKLIDKDISGNGMRDVILDETAKTIKIWPSTTKEYGNADGSLVERNKTAYFSKVETFVTNKARVLAAIAALPAGTKIIAGPRSEVFEKSDITAASYAITLIAAFKGEVVTRPAAAAGVTFTAVPLGEYLIRSMYDASLRTGLKRGSVRVSGNDIYMEVKNPAIAGEFFQEKAAEITACINKLAVGSKIFVKGNKDKAEYKEVMTVKAVPGDNIMGFYELLKPAVTPSEDPSYVKFGDSELGLEVARLAGFGSRSLAGMFNLKWAFTEAAQAEERKVAAAAAKGEVYIRKDGSDLLFTTGGLFLFGAGPQWMSGVPWAESESMDESKAFALILLSGGMTHYFSENINVTWKGGVLPIKYATTGSIADKDHMGGHGNLTNILSRVLGGSVDIKYVKHSVAEDLDDPKDSDYPEREKNKKDSTNTIGVNVSAGKMVNHVLTGGPFFSDPLSGAYGISSALYWSYASGMKSPVVKKSLLRVGLEATRGGDTIPDNTLGHVLGMVLFNVGAGFYAGPEAFVQFGSAGLGTSYALNAIVGWSGDIGLGTLTTDLIGGYGQTFKTVMEGCDPAKGECGSGYQIASKPGEKDPVKLIDRSYVNPGWSTTLRVKWETNPGKFLGGTGSVMPWIAIGESSFGQDGGGFYLTPGIALGLAF